MLLATFLLISTSLISVLAIPITNNLVATNPFGSCRGGSLYVVAHPDDDLLFQSPDLIDDMLTSSFNKCITTIYLTSGDAGLPGGYAESRENGNQAASASIIGINNQWSEFNTTFSGSGQVTIHCLGGAEYIQKIWFRLPDGNVDGSGYSTTNLQTLRKLYFGDIGSIDNILGTATFTLSSLQTTISSIITQLAPARIRTLDYLSQFDSGDHSDHYTTARITQSLASGTALTGYMGYPIQNFAPSLSTSDITAKANAFFTYTTFDPSECQSFSLCSGRGEAAWLQRQYLTSPALATGGTISTISATVISPSLDLALNSTATASSSAPNQGPEKIIDGVVSGYLPIGGDFSKEWASQGQGIGATLKLTWTNSIIINQIVLFDRPNLDDQVLAATITFSDRSIISIPTLNNDGSATYINLTKQVTTSTLVLTITAVSASTSNIGLSELQVYGSISQSTITTTSTPIPSNSTTLPTNSTITTNSTLISSSLDLALNSTATASSSAPNQGPEKSIDGVVSGYLPIGGDFSKEWASQGQGIGATLKLTWTNSIIINQIVLFDRPNLDDQVLSATITFSDGSIISIPTLNNDGSATYINLIKPITTSTLVLTITAVSASTSNIGLSEIKVYGPIIPPTQNIKIVSSSVSTSPTILSTLPSTSLRSTLSYSSQSKPLSTSTTPIMPYASLASKSNSIITSRNSVVLFRPTRSLALTSKKSAVTPAY